MSLPTFYTFLTIILLLYPLNCLSYPPPRSPTSPRYPHTKFPPLSTPSPSSPPKSPNSPNSQIPSSPASPTHWESLQIAKFSKSPLMEKFYTETGLKASYRIFNKEAPEEFQAIYKNLIELSEEADHLTVSKNYYSQLVHWMKRLLQTQEGQKWIEIQKRYRAAERVMLMDFSIRLQVLSIFWDLNKPTILTRGQWAIKDEVEALARRQLANEELKSNHSFRGKYIAEKKSIEQEFDVLVYKFKIATDRVTKKLNARNFN